MKGNVSVVRVCSPLQISL